MEINYRKLATSNHPTVQVIRRIRRSIATFTLPAPRAIVRPALLLYVSTQSIFHFLVRVFVCEPLFKAACTRCGDRVRTGVFIHWINGKGELIVGDDVVVDGKCSISFAARFADKPTLMIGDHTGISHNCRFVIGKRISIGRYCRIAGEAFLFDSNGHTSDPAGRQAGLPPTEEEVRPITIHDNVWIGRRAVICPGVTIGEGSIVSTSSVVMADVAPYTIVAGNPARRIGVLASPPNTANSAQILPEQQN